MFDQAWEYIQFFRYEILAAAVLIGLELIRRRYSDNKRITAFIEWSMRQVAIQLEKEVGKPLTDSASGKRKLRRKIRRQIAKESRKLNRGTGKGSKRGK